MAANNSAVLGFEKEIRKEKASRRIVLFSQRNLLNHMPEILMPSLSMGRIPTP